MARARLPHPRITALVAVLTCLSAPAARCHTAPDAGAPDAGAVPAESVQLLDHLRTLEQHLRGHLRPAAGFVADGRMPAAKLLREHDLLLAQLDLLEARVRTLEPHAGGELWNRLRFLRDEVRHLGIAVAGAEPGGRTPPEEATAAKTPAMGSLADGPPPGNDDCAAARPIGDGTIFGDATGATADGRAACTPGNAGPDLWYRYTATADVELAVYLTEDSTPGHGISVHAVCPGTPLNELTCRSRFPVAAGEEILVRVASRDDGPEGPFTLIVEPASTLSGTVTDAETGAPVPAVEVEIWNQDEDVGNAVTDGEGRYTASTLHPGTHFVQARAETHRGKVFDDVPCDDDCSPQDVGTPIEVGRNAQITGIDFALERLASISGRVTDATTGAPIADATVDVATSSGRIVRTGTTDALGDYTAGGLDPDTYFVKVTATGYFRELYDELRCPDPDCSAVDGTPIPVADEATVTGIDFALESLGRITGTVTSTTGQPLHFVQIRVRDEQRSSLRSTAWTGENGDYSVGDLYAGSYLVTTVNYDGWADEAYDDQPCPKEDCDPRVGMAVPVAAGATTAGIDFALAPAGVVTGTVTDGRTGAAVSRAQVFVFGADGFPLDVSSADHRGRYRLTGLADGTYFAVVDAAGRIPELYDDLPCPGAPYGCDATAGTPIPAATGTITAGIDFVLASQGISGRVTDRLTGEPLRYASVWIRDLQGEPVANSGTGFTGSYRVLDVPPGTYRVTAQGFGYRPQLYDGIPCVDAGCDPTAGDLVEVEADTLVRNVDFALTPLGTITGTVRDATGAPLSGVSVSARNAAGFRVRSNRTGRDGHYTLDDLAPDTYVVQTSNQEGYTDELYDDRPCGEAGCDDDDATPIPIALGSAVAGVDFVLDRSGTLFGTVSNTVNGSPIYSVEVRVWDADGALAASDSTDESGAYAVHGLAPGSYFVTTWDSHSGGFIDLLYDRLPCRYGACDPTAGTPVEVGFNQPSTGIDFLLDLEQGISGRVTHEVSGLPVLGTVDVWDSDGRHVTDLWIDAAGNYAGALPIGTYFLSTDVRGGHPSFSNEIYDGIPCPRSGCDPTVGTPVTVTGGAVLRDLDFTPSGPYCDRFLCLDGDRFTVSVRWLDFDLGGGTGTPEQLTDDAGTFWFFGPDNVELVVKVLDACVEPFNHFWVFAAGLTNVATEIVVTDSWTREQRVYVNPLGSPFELIRDTTAFTCELPAAEPAALDAGQGLAHQTRRELEDRLQLLAAGETSKPAIAAPAEPLGGAGACLPTATTLCLGDGRFQVDSTWRTAEGDLGVGQAVPLTGDSGTFWFFGPDNVEAIVKVLDACGLPAFRSFWVFAAGLTDVEVTLKVTDTVSGEVREYVNPLGTPFRAIQDTDAFATCP